MWTGTRGEECYCGNLLWQSSLTLLVREDWNGGCCGFGDSGARYYQGGTKMSAIIPRLVMYGIVTPDDIRRDITTGNVDGIWYLGDGASRVWYDSDASIGFLENPFRKESPCHN